MNTYDEKIFDSSPFWKINIILRDKGLDFTQYLAGPTVGRLMAEMGRKSLKLKLLRTEMLQEEFQSLKARKSGCSFNRIGEKESLFRRKRALTNCRDLLRKWMSSWKTLVRE